MALTPAQQTALKAYIDATPELAAIPNDTDGAFAAAAILNQIASPAFIVWRTNVPTKDIRNVVVWSEYDGLSVSKQNAFTFLCSNGVVDASNTNVRDGIASIFSGAQQTGNRTALIAIAKRSATVVEKVLATGTGTTNTPATMGFEGTISYQDVQAARNS